MRSRRAPPTSWLAAHPSTNAVERRRRRPTVRLGFAPCRGCEQRDRQCSRDPRELRPATFAEQRLHVVPHAVVVTDTYARAPCRRDGQPQLVVSSLGQQLLQFDLSASRDRDPTRGCMQDYLAAAEAPGRVLLAPTRR